MAWTTNLVTALRVIIADMDSVSYTDARLQSILSVGALYVKQEINWSTVYTIDITVPTISPDPTLTATLNTDFSNFIVLKSACLINQGELRTKAIIAGLEAKCGPAVLKTGGHLDGFKQLIEIGPCAMYEVLKKEYRFGNQEVAGILSPFINDNFSPSDLYVTSEREN
jgi:hypothetical protein